jgi:uncharacterized protein (DUF2344 family)
MKRLLSILCRDIQLKTHIVQVSRVDSKKSERDHGVLTDPKYCVCVDEANLTSLTKKSIKYASMSSQSKRMWDSEAKRGER